MDGRIVELVKHELEAEIEREPVTTKRASRIVAEMPNIVRKSCGCEHSIIVKVGCSNSTTQYRRYCYECEKLTNPIRHASLSEQEKKGAIEFDGLGADTYHGQFRQGVQELTTTLLLQRGFHFEYESYLQSKAWEKARQTVFELDGGKCQVCNTRQATQCHHLHYSGLGSEDAADLIAVCVPCHERITEDMKYWRNQLAPSFVVVRGASFYKNATRKDAHYESLKRELVKLELKPDDYERRITELAKAMEV